VFETGANAYRKTRTVTANQAQLVVQLYEGIVLSVGYAIQALAEGNLEGAHVSLKRAQEIITTLRGTLRRDAGPVAQNLDALYDYFFRRLVEANVNKDPSPAQEILGYTRQLLATWRIVASEPTLVASRVEDLDLAVN
jgi:flagellar protein FliS